MTPKQLALLHAARRKLGLDEDSYRAVLKRHGDVDSAKELTPEGFKRVVDHFRASGFAKLDPQPGDGRAFGDRPGFATAAQVDYIRNLWRAYSDDGGERGLDRWLERSFKVTALRFLPAEAAQKAITGLKRMTARKSAAGQDGGQGTPSPAA